ncbi:transcriptional regulator [Porphyromonas pogonae]|uniref:winged helix-turn-helix domain-containing protein n=1 Tax=Porphyromonas pogonae TaxID=867595 RepID=UPI002E77DF6F|nr:transcriptional regulator [Porphyromonas pogonae]
MESLDPIIHSELRLAVMSLLISLEEADFVFLKNETGVSAGNLSLQLDKLAGAGYVKITKSFKGKRPCTTIKITRKGIDAFDHYVEALKSYINHRL